MNYKKHGDKIVEIIADNIIIKNSADALNIIFESGADTIIINKNNIDPDFFKLGTGFAGDVLQKFSNYKMRLGIIGDYTTIKSKPMKDLIYECNKNKEIIFIETLEEALKVFQYN